MLTYNKNPNEQFTLIIHEMIPFRFRRFAFSSISSVVDICMRQTPACQLFRLERVQYQCCTRSQDITMKYEKEIDNKEKENDDEEKK